MPVAKPSKAEVAVLYAEWKLAGSPPIEIFSRRVKNRSPMTVRRCLQKYAKEYGLAQNAEPIVPKTFDKKIRKAPRYVITSAQNATPIHKGFFAALRRYCEAHSAELIVIPIRYRNPTSMWSANDSGDDWWDPAVRPYLNDSRHMLCSNLAVLADIKVQPTATDPISGLESISRGESCIVGHPKVALTVAPAPSHATPKLIVTTGSVTEANYTNTKAGKKGEFHHSLAAVVVELSGKTFHLRHVSAVADGSFIDLDTEYSAKAIKNAPPALAVVMGDTHAWFADKSVLNATFDAADSLVRTVRPAHIVWHDTLDFYSANHHHRGEPFIALAKHNNGYADVEKEVRHAFSLVGKYMAMFKNTKHVFPHSNHDAALYRWVKECDWRSDPRNAVFYLETALYLAKNTAMKGNGASTPDPFKYWGEKLLANPERCNFLTADEAFVLAGVSLGNHGHMGANGARGSLRGVAKQGVKSIVGHSHTPGIYEGGMQVGTTSLLRLGYNKGASSWLHTHAVLYANGKRTLINFINGRYKS